MSKKDICQNFFGLWGRCPQAIAKIKGGEIFPVINGYARFYKTHIGVLVVVKISGLPALEGENGRMLGFYIQESKEASLFETDGVAFSSFVTSRYSIQNIIGQSVAIYAYTDAPTTQSYANSGVKIAAGEILG